MNMTYEQYQKQIEKWMEGQDELYYQGYQVTPDFDMVINNRRVRPKVQKRGCFPPRVKRVGQVGPCGTTWTPKMVITPLC